MTPKNRLFLLLFIISTLSTLQANDAARIAALELKVAALEKTVGSQPPSLFRIRSLKDFGSWVRHNNGKITVTAGCFVAYCVFRKIWNEQHKKTRAYARDLHEHTRTDVNNNVNALREESRNNNSTMNANIQAIAQKVGAETADLPPQVIPKSAGPIPADPEDTLFSKATNLIADCAIYAFTRPISWTWNLVKHTII